MIALSINIEALEIVFGPDAATILFLHPSRLPVPLAKLMIVTEISAGVPPDPRS